MGPAQPSIFASARAWPTGFRVVQTRRYKCDSTRSIARSISLPPPRALTKLKADQNAPELSNYPDIDGFLVGGASLKPEICEIVKEIAVAKNTFAMGGA